MMRGSQKGKERIETTIFVPATKSGKLTEMLKEKEEELAKLTKFRVRYQEAGGTKLGLMFSTDLAAGESRESKRPNCKAQNIL